MTEDNELKRRIRGILNTNDPKLKQSLKVDLRAWATDKITNITSLMIDELNREELGIYMKWGAEGNHYNYAYERNRKKKQVSQKNPEITLQVNPLKMRRNQC